MELLQLRYFFESSLNESFSQTAKKYMVPPSSVSLTIKRLEDELGCQLFDRKANKITLNAQGKALRTTLATVLNELDSTVSAIKQSSTEVSSEINILIKNQNTDILKFIRKYKELHPNVVFKITQNCIYEEYENFDIIIDIESRRYNNYRRLPLTSEKLQIIASKKHYTFNENCTLSDLHENNFIMYNETNPLRDAAIKCCERAGYKPHIILESDNDEFIAKAVENDLGIAIVPESFLKRVDNDKIGYLSVYNFNVYYNTCVYIETNIETSAAAYTFFKDLLLDINKRTILWHKVKQKSAE